jgi:zinc protease
MITSRSFKIALGSLSALALIACTAQDGTTPVAKDDSTKEASSKELVSFEEFELENGLKVIFHIDRSDPVVAVALTAHVGSAREKPGRTGFAHLFEHLLFLESENLGKGGLDAMSARIGGSGANGSTSRDRTNYFQTVPKDALEKMIWAEADKIGWFINTVTEPVLAKEKEVVKNEKRQSVDNRPYGHTFYVIGKNMYPEGHPYNWQVIGSLEDLQAATLQDVKDFYRDWYTPNNVTLVIAGDFDTAQARSWVEKYFNEIPRGPEVEPLPKQPVQLTEVKSLYHEDNFAQLPQLTMAWHTVPQYHPDAYALDVLAELLTVGKEAPLNEVLIDEKKVTSNVAMFGYNSELAGDHMLSVTGFAGTDLDEVKAALDEGFARFEADGIDPDDLNRVKITQEVGFYNSIGSVLGKAFSLAQYEIFAGDPGFINQDIKNIQGVTADDVMRVYETYIKDKPYVVTSFVPRGNLELALEGSVKADVVEEKIVAGAEDTFDPSQEASYERTPSTFDRTQEPPYGETPQLRTPDVWEASTDNGIDVYGIKDSELPLVRFQLSIAGGQYLDSLDAPGAANLTAEILTKGTASMTTAELEDALASLGAELDVFTTAESFVFSGQTLARNFDDVMDLLSKVVLTPRWDEEEFDLAKSRTVNAITAAKADPRSIAEAAYRVITFGEDHILSRDALGTEESVKNFTIDDLKAWYAKSVTPGNARFLVVGDVSQADVGSALAKLDSWSGEAADIPDYGNGTQPTEAKVYFYDVPGAKQSQLRIGYPALKRTDEEYYEATVMNYILGGGGFASRLTQELREGKGYTYGISSGFNGSTRVGTFRISSGVRSNVTLEAIALIRDILGNYADTFTEADLETTKSFQIKSKARAFESLGAKLNVLNNISAYDLPYDYVAEQNRIVEGMTKEDIQALAASYIRPNEMNYIVIGDAETQAGRLEELGLGTPIMVKERVDSLSE